MQIIFYKAKYGSFTDKLIAFFTRSKYSHVELVFSDGVCGSSSARDGGVRLKTIDMDSHWDIFDLPNVYDESAIRYWFYINDGDSYDWLGAISSVFRIDLTTEDKKFCSYTVAINLGLSPIRSPGSLYRTLVSQGTIK